MTVIVPLRNAATLACLQRVRGALGKRPLRCRDPLALGALLSVWIGLTIPGTPVAAPGHAHVHGQAQLEVSLDSARLSLLFQIPMEAIVGFERAPRNDEERARLDRAIELLRAPGLFRPSPDAQCKAEAPTLTWSSGGPTALPPEDSHTDLRLSLAFDCAEPSRLGAVEVGAFDAFSRLRRIEARVAGPTGSTSRVLQRGRRALELKR